VHRDADSWSKEQAEAFKAPIREKYETEGNPYYATARLWDDGVIDPAQTPRCARAGLAALSEGADSGCAAVRVFRM
jgi:3-methylcrotonyl-CoA carboxylase beta subunit